MENDVNSDRGQENREPPPTISNRDKARFVTSKLKSGAKRLLGRDHDGTDSDPDEVSDLFEDAAYNPKQVLDPKIGQNESFRAKLHRGVHDIAITIKNPKAAARSDYTRTVAGSLGGQPVAYAQEYDKELVDAYDALEHANAQANDNSTKQSSDRSISTNPMIDKARTDQTITLEDNVANAKAKLQEVEAKRDSLMTAWILGRHVNRVTVPRPMPRPPTKSEFVERSPGGMEKNFHWDRYLGQSLLWQTRDFAPYHIDDFDAPPFDLKELSLAIERLVIASTPWQSFLMEVRSVYLWERPGRTLRFMTAYLFLWYLQQMTAAILAWVIFLTIQGRFRSTRIESIRGRVARVEDDQTTAQAWGELIQRHGKHDWIEPLLDDLGPIAQMEVTDMTSLMEKMQSFYRWERPNQNLVILSVLGACLLFSLVVSTEFLVRMVELGFGLYFFVSLPLSARHPRYRKLFNPAWWLFWNVPNTAELAIAHLQEKANLRDATRLRAKRTLNGPGEQPESISASSRLSTELTETTSQQHNTDDLQTLQDEDQATFQAIHPESHQLGNLRLLRQGIKYYDKKLEINVSYSQIIEMKKVDFSKSNDPTSSKTARFAQRIEQSSSLQVLPSGIEFVFVSPMPDPDPKGTETARLVLTVSQADRDKIFSLVISWSDLVWQPQFSLNKRNRFSQDQGHPTKRGKGNRELDTAIKSITE